MNSTISKPVTASGAPRSLRSNFSWTAVGQIVNAICQWAIIAMLAKAGAPDIVGQFAYGLAITAPLFLLTNLSLRTVIATDAQGQFQFREYLSLRLITVIFSLAAVFLYVVILDSWELGIVILAIAMGKALDATSDVAHGFYQNRERMDLVAKSFMVNGVGSLVATSMFLYITGEVFWAAVGYASGSAASLLAVNLPTTRRLLKAANHSDGQSMKPLYFSAGKVAEELSRMKPLFLMALPLGLSAALVSLASNAPRYALEHYLGSWELGIYAALSYLIVIGGTVVTALGQSALPRLARYYSEGRSGDIAALVMRLAAMSMLISCLGYLLTVTVGDEIITLMYGKEYSGYIGVLEVLVLGSVFSFMGLFLDYGISASRRFGLQLPIHLVVTAVTFAASAVLIPRFGIMGGAWVFTAGMILQWAMKLLALSHVLRRVSNARHDR